MKRDNKGMSLIEILMVVAVLSTLVGVVGLGVRMVSGKAAEECAQKLCSSIQHARTITMGKNKTSIILFRDEEERLVVKEVSEQILDDDGNLGLQERQAAIGKKDVIVSCQTEDGSSVEIVGSNTLELEFDRGSGALKKTKINGTEVDSCTQITIEHGNKTKYIVITPVTGKVVVTDTP